MGCDIHAYVEVKSAEGWTHHDWRKPYQIGTYEDGSPEYDYDNGYWEHPLRIGRNYDLFAILANVRNGHGFAGVETGTGFEPISLPRGLPTDVTPEVMAASDGWNGDGHSHSWLLLSELLAVDYDGKSTTQYGVVGMAGYLEWKEKGTPSSYSGDVWGKNIRKVSNAEMESFIGIELDFEPVTHVAWQESYKDAVGEQWFEALAKLQKLGNPDKVRLVFFFDN